jgi:hypothetical protein
MTALLTALALFGTAWLVHLLWWRLAPPRRHTAALLFLFALLPVPAALALPAGLLPAAAEVPGVLALYAGAAACYLIVYTGIEQTSPTLVLVRALERAGQGGCSREDLMPLITDDLFVRPRLEALALDGLISRQTGGWALTPRGRRAARAATFLAGMFGVRENA